MKTWKVFSVLLVLAFLVASTGWAVEVEGDSNYTNVVASGDITAGDAITAGGELTFRSTLLANGRAGGASTMSSSSTYLSAAGIAYSVIQKRVGGVGGLDERGWGSLLPNGTPGQELAIQIVALQGSGTWILTVRPTTHSTGFTRIVFDTIGDNVVLLYVNDTVGWIIKSMSGVTVTINQIP